MNDLLASALEPVVRRRREFRFFRELAVAVALLVAGAWWAAHFLHRPADRLQLGLALGVLVGTVALLARRHYRWQPDFRQIARSIEQRHPELHALLITAVEQRPEAATGQLNFLQQRVVKQALAESRRHAWLDETPGYQRLGARVAGVLAVACAALLTGQLLWSARSTSGLALAEPQLTVTPGDAELERGSGLVITARFAGRVPSTAALVLQPRQGTARTLELARNLQDPVYGGGLPEVTDDLTYRIEYAGGVSRDFQVRVFERPRLERADATLRPPAYTRLPEKKLPEVRRLSGVEGSKVEVAFQLNKPVAAAWLQGKDGAKVPLALEAGAPRATLRDFPLAASQTYELHLQDAEGRTNQLPETFALDVLPNRRPELKRELPRGDGRVSPLQEMEFIAKAWDDFGLLAWGVSVSLPSGETKELVLGRETAPDVRVEGRELVKLEAVGVQPDDLISWHLWADDLGPDGKPRRTTGDIYFAEVRPFEELFRAGEQPPPGGAAAGGKGQGEQAMKLAELQKEVIAATWNLQRREEPLPAYQKDVPVIRDSETSAIAQAEALQEKLEEPKAKGFAEEAVRQMKSAVEQLTRAEPAPPLLPEAVAPEQRAYAALLKLAAHEFNVTRGQPPPGQSKGGQQRQQQQLDELELKEDRNRYEAKSEAAAEPKEQQEQLAVLSRLKELAQRQQDLNEKLKEAQTALQEAKTEAAREEAKRQLKRLQEEQQQMLADMDELKQSMEQSGQQADLAAERKRLEEARQEAQKAAEGLRQEKPTEALAAGTRSEKELQQLRDDFRKKGAARFREEMRDMRQSARELAGHQEEIGKQIEGAAAEKKGRALQSLDAPAPQEKLDEQLAQQQTGLEQLQKQMRAVSEQAEQAEPLLSRQLYDSLRKSAQAGTEETLQRAARLARGGLLAQAQGFEQKARQEVTDLKEGVERAAGSVLGDETEALRQARAELDQLANQINREIARARPELAQNSPQGEQKARAEEAAGNPGDAPPSAPGKAKGDQQAKDGASRSPAAAKGQPPGEGKGSGKGKPNGEGENVEQGQPGSKPNSNGGKGDQPGQGQEGGGNQKGQTAGTGQPPSEGQKPGQQGQGTSQNPRPGQGRGGAGGAANRADGESAAKPASGPRELSGTPGSLPKGNPRNGSETGGGGEEEGAVLTGENYVRWSDRLRNVEEMLEDRGLRNQVAEVREEARKARADFKRHSQEPQWEAMQLKISRPLADLRDRVSEELARKGSREALVPIDRDPVPPRYAERVRRYYEELGK